MEKINLCFLTDDGYILQTCVAITSAQINKNEESIYNIYVLCYNVSDKNKEKIRNLQNKNFNIFIINLDIKENYNDFKILDIPATPTAIFKFNIPNILSNIDRVIYIDGDVIIKGDLTNLYNTDIKNNYIGAIKETGGLSKTLYRLYITKNVFYFNSGVMLINLKKMREDNISDKLIQYRKNGYNELMDQDALNYVLRNNVFELSFKYNTQLMFAYICNKIIKLKKYYNLSEKFNTIEEVLDNSLILHFSGHKKPWKHIEGYGHEEWMYYYYKSPFKNNMIIRTKYNKKRFSIKDLLNREFKNYRRYKFMKLFIRKEK